jgi:hypothetical protein
MQVWQDELFLAVEPLPGAIKLVHHLKKHRIPMAIATSSQRRNFELKTKHLPHLFGCFDPEHVVTGDDPQLAPGRGKPHPDIFELAASKIGITTDEHKARTIVFEDGLPGLVFRLRSHPSDLAQVSKPVWRRNVRSSGSRTPTSERTSTSKARERTLSLTRCTTFVRKTGACRRTKPPKPHPPSSSTLMGSLSTQNRCGRAPLVSCPKRFSSYSSSRKR